MTMRLFDRVASPKLGFLLILCAIINTDPVIVGAEPVNSTIIQSTTCSRVWMNITVRTNTSGIVVSLTNRYTELGDGLCRFDKNGVLVDCSDEITPTDDGAAATNTLHKAYWKANINTAGGALTFLTPSNQVLKSTIVGVCFYDTTADTNLLIAGLKDSQGVLVASNQIVYPDAFLNIHADVFYRNLLQGISQNIIFREQLPSPTAYGLNPDSTEVQILTEFFAPPSPRVLSQTNQTHVDNYVLDFGDLLIPVGRAFFAGTNNEHESAGWVRKRWVNVENRTFLVEPVPWSVIAQLQQQLPAHASIMRVPNMIRRLANLERGLGTPSPHATQLHLPSPGEFHRTVREAGHPIPIAANFSSTPGVILDYETLNGSVNNGFTFITGNTYYLSGSFTVTGGTVSMQGGAVLKFGTNTSLVVSAPAQISCLSTDYFPVILTAKDDNAVGDSSIPGSTGQPSGWYGNPAIAFYGSSSSNSTLNLHHFRISYAEEAIYAQGISLTAGLSDGQVTDCDYGFDTPGQSEVAINNVLFANFGAALTLDYANLSAENDTFACWPPASAYLVSGNNYTTASLTNCIIVGVDSYSGQITHLVTGANNGFYQSGGASGWYYHGATFGTSAYTAGSYPFQTFAGGDYYLTTNSAFRQAGASLESTLAMDLARKTTSPPSASAIYSNITVPNATISSLLLSPQTARDTNAFGAPDLGYHYCPIDAVLSGATLNGGSLTVAPGTVVAFMGPGTSNTAGLQAQDSSQVRFSGIATNPVFAVTCETVQESPLRQWLFYDSAGSGGDAFATLTGANPAFPYFRFTTGYTVGEEGLIYGDQTADGSDSAITLQDCQFNSGDIQSYAPAILSSNCLYNETEVNLSDLDGFYEVKTTYNNSLFLGGTFTTFHDRGGTWTFTDNLFDETATYTGLQSGDVVHYNAYIDGYSNLTWSPEPDSQTLATSPSYSTGPLGSYYYTSSMAQLIHSGSRSAAAAGLYHYTVTNDNTLDSAPNGTSQVSIGFHYVACDSYGRPLDTDGDGLPDYIEDLNGDGVYDSGDLSDWQSADTGGTGVPDGQKDNDHDGISNLAELMQYGSDPNNANSLDPVNDDGRYLFSAQNDGHTQASLTYAVSNGMVQFTISGAAPNAQYDIYFVNNAAAQNWQWRRVYCGVQCNSIGSAQFQMEAPDPNQNYFVALDASDDDGDGLRNGYEAWFTYTNGANVFKTIIENRDSDGDGLRDGWEVEYGLNPTSSGGSDGGGSYPIGDIYSNKQKHDLYTWGDASYDPLFAYNGSADRPIVTVSTATPNPTGTAASFTFTRWIGNAGNLNNPLTVYYSIGGTLAYGNGNDYTLSPSPNNYPSIFSVQIPAAETSATVDVTLTGSTPSSLKTLIVRVTPYSVAAGVFQSNNWQYVIDPRFNRVTIDFGGLQPPNWVLAASHQWTPRLGGGNWYQPAGVINGIIPAISDYTQPLLVGLRSDRGENGYRFDLNQFDPSAQTYTWWFDRISQEGIINTLSGTGNVQFLWSMPMPVWQTQYGNIIPSGTTFNSENEYDVPTVPGEYYYYTNSQDDCSESENELIVNNARICPGTTFQAGSSSPQLFGSAGQPVTATILWTTQNPYANNVIPGGATYGANGEYVLSTVAGGYYTYTSSSDDCTEGTYELVVNGTRICSGTTFVAGSQATLYGPASASVTATVTPEGAGYPWQTADYYAAYLEYMTAPATMSDVSGIPQQLDFFNEQTWQPDPNAETTVQGNWANLRAARGHRDPYPIIAVILGIEPYGAESVNDQEVDNTGSYYASKARTFEQAIRGRAQNAAFPSPLSSIPLGLHVHDVGKPTDDTNEETWFHPMFSALSDANNPNGGDIHNEFSYFDMQHYYQNGCLDDWHRVYPGAIYPSGYPYIDNYDIPWPADFSRYLWQYEDLRVAVTKENDDPQRWQVGNAEHGMATSLAYCADSAGTNMYDGIHWALWLSELMRYGADGSSWAQWDMPFVLCEQGSFHALLQDAQNSSGTRILVKTGGHFAYKLADEFWGDQVHDNTYTSPTVTNIENPAYGYTTYSSNVVVRVFRDPSSDHYHLFVINKDQQNDFDIDANTQANPWRNWTVAKWTQFNAPSLDTGNALDGSSEPISIVDVTSTHIPGSSIIIPHISVNHIELKQLGN